MERYRIVVQGHLDERWAAWLAPLSIERRPDGTTSLAGEVADQAALFGLLLKIRDMNLTLLALERLGQGA